MARLIELAAGVLLNDVSLLSLALGLRVSPSRRIHHCDTNTIVTAVAAVVGIVAAVVSVESISEPIDLSFNLINLIIDCIITSMASISFVRGECM